jgi:hypothetical protein
MKAVGEEEFERVSQNQCVVSHLMEQRIERRYDSVDPVTADVYSPESALRRRRAGDTTVAIHHHS